MGEQGRTTIQLCSFLLCDINLRFQDCRESRDSCDLPEDMATFSLKRQWAWPFLAGNGCRQRAKGTELGLSSVGLAVLGSRQSGFLSSSVISSQHLRQCHLHQKQNRRGEFWCLQTSNLLSLAVSISPRKLMISSTPADPIDLCRMHPTEEMSVGICCDLTWKYGYSHASLRFWFLDWLEAKCASFLEQKQTAIPYKYVGYGLKGRKFYLWLIKKNY